jgi:hypothetical protein
LGCGRAVIASDGEEERELPGSCVERFADDAEGLATLLASFAAHTDRREAMERAAHDFAERKGRWSTIAARVVEFLDAFPPPRSARKSLIAVQFAQARERARARSHA